MIDPLTEDLVWPAAATSHYPRGPDGKKVHISNVYRDMKKGHMGIVLESIRTPRLATSRQALARFFARLSQASQRSEQSGPAERFHRSQDLSVEAELERLGL